MLGASIDRDRSARFRTAAFKRRCRRIDLFVKRPSVNVQWVRKNGHRPERGEWIFGTANRVPRSGTFSLLLVLSFNLVAHLHRRVLTRRTLQQAFPRAFHQPARKFRATLIYLDRDRLHDTYFFFLFFRSPFSVLRAERPSVIRARPPAVNVARSWKKIYHLAPEFGNKSLALSRSSTMETPSRAGNLPVWRRDFVSHDLQLHVFPADFILYYFAVVNLRLWILNGMFRSSGSGVSQLSFLHSLLASIRCNRW